jgi:CelD/BcsL family acetyltransferase involved in cellulose biosynthesis
VLIAEARHGRFRGYWLERDGSPLVFQVGARWRNTYRLLATAYLPELRRFSPGIVLHMRVLRLLCESGIDSVDYGYGDAEYKRTYGSDCTEHFTLHLYGAGLKSCLARGIDASSDRASRFARRVTGVLGMTDALKKKWRARLQRGHAHKRGDQHSGNGRKS